LQGYNVGGFGWFDIIQWIGAFWQATLICRQDHFDRLNGPDDFGCWACRRVEVPNSYFYFSSHNLCCPVS